ncbi:response regulator [Chitinophaga pendula]|uniref:response regulator n=1 Tax=Chitinophaga TaxID=79328 RepID=UPI000BAFB10B|nr:MULTISPECIES: response regulator [Chitinophaga]ASZ12537.1 histidine kinase [Chitinophaga sp. MD30]UCJ09859.1 response regulator [Chitinophaga pendula]
MKLSLVNRLYLGFALVISLILVGGYLTWQTFNTQTEEAGWVQHTYRVLNNSERVQRLLFDMEASRRGFRSTFNKRFLEPYETALPKVAPAINDLRTMVSDNPVQFRNTDSLERAVNSLLSFWNELDHLTTQQRFDQNVAITEQETLLMDKVRARINTVNLTERHLLAKREELKNSSFTKAIKTLLLNNLFILLVGFILMRVTYAEFKRRLKVQKALNSKLHEVVELNKATNKQNWLLTGVNNMNDSLQGINNRDNLVATFLRTLTGFAGFPAGAMYRYEENRNKLVLAGTAGMPIDVQHEIALNEGLIGTTASQKALQVIRDIPPGYWQLSSASGKMTPGSLVFVPLWIGDELLGVIELACFQEVTQAQLELLEVLSKDITVAVNAANDRSKVMSLLQQVQEQREILIAQQEELRQSNEELSRQSEILQASEEELKVQEEELRQVNAEITEKNKALEAARSALALKANELQSSSQYKSEFLANMSHELRTPLNSVLILAKMLQENKEKNLHPKQIEYAGIIYKSGSDLLHLINDVLDLSKIEAGKVELNYETVPVAVMNNDVADLFDVLSQEKNIRFIRHITGDVPDAIETDKLRLGQVIRNLLSNAFKFTPSGGEISLSWYMAGDDVLGITVADTGPGIPTEQQTLIFSAFQQGDGSISRKYGGTGLGLSISKKLMELLKGELRLDSSTSAGSVFSILVPIGEIVDTTIPAISTPALHPIATTAIEQQTAVTVNDDRNNISYEDKLVLIIEDDTRFADILRDFAREKGFKTIVAHNGQDGLAYARRYLPAAIILDMDLPVIDGNSILKILKSNEELSKILVHVVTGAEQASIATNNIHGYTRKPLALDDLEQVFTSISRLLSGRYKKVLLLSAGPLGQDAALSSISNKRKLAMAYDITGLDKAEHFIREQSYDAVVLEVDTPIGDIINRLQKLRQLTDSSNTPLIVYLDQDITPQEEQQLKRYSSAIVRNSVHARDRLIDELELFLYKLEKKISTGTKEAEDGDSTLSGKTILLADDDMRNVFSISALMEEQGVHVLTAADGKEALEILDRYPKLDLVLMDIMMPEMDGYEAIGRIRSDARFQQLPVIALTAKAMAGDRQKCIEAGASDYIAKPIDNAKLLSLLSVWLS